MVDIKIGFQEILQYQRRAIAFQKIRQLCNSYNNALPKLADRVFAHNERITPITLPFISTSLTTIGE